MKDRIIQSALSLVLTFGGVFFAVLRSIETPPYLGESLALASVALLNALWLVPYTIKYLRQWALQKAAGALLRYVLPVAAVALYVGYYHQPFDAAKWKADFLVGRTYDNYPAHAHGEMVTDFLESYTAVGLSGPELDTLLGTSYYTEKRGADTARYYFYDSDNMFDGCDKIYVRLHQGRCIEAFHAGCD